MGAFDQLALGIYYPADSLIHRLRARTKLLALFWLIAFVTIANQQSWRLAPYIVLVALVCVAALLSRAGIGYLWRQIRLLALAALLGALTVALFAEGDAAPLYALGPLVVTTESLWLAARFVVVLVSLYSLALLLTMTTTPAALVEGLTLLLAPLRRLALPVDELALTTLLALRFIPTLGEEVESLVKAQASRGADFSRGTLCSRIDALAALVVPIFQAIWRRAEALATALEARGYALDGRQTMLYETSLTVSDYLTLAAVALVTIGSLML